METITVKGSTYRTSLEDFTIEEAYESYINACGTDSMIPRPARKAIRIAIEHEIERNKNNVT